MPPRAQKRKLDDSPYAGLKRSNLASASNGLYPREPRERDRDGGYGSTAAGMTGREREYYDKYSGLSSYEREAIGPAQGNKRRKVEAAAPGPSSGYYATGGNALPREEGPLITMDLSTLPHSAILKYLQTYNLTPAVNPPAISVQRPSTPHTLLKSPSVPRQSTTSHSAIAPASLPATARATPALPYGRYPHSHWDEQELQDSIKSKSLTSTIKTHILNGVVTSSTFTTTTTSILGLSAANLEVEAPLEHTALYDVEEARNSLTKLAQFHWDLMNSAYKNAPPPPVFGASALAVASAGNRLSEREVIEDFMIGLRAKELSIRLSA